MTESPKVPEKSGEGPAPERRSPASWEEQLAELARKGCEARRGLVEAVARERAFAFMDEHIGRSPEDFPELLDEVTASYQDGRYFLEHLGLFFEVSPSLSLLVFQLRQEWIREFELKTVPELLLLDQAMLAYFHVLRAHREIANTLALTEADLFCFDSPIAKVKQRHGLSEFKGFKAEDSVRRIRRELLPLVERYSQMFLRTLRAINELRAAPLTISIRSADQVNIGQQQVNVGESSAGR